MDRRQHAAVLAQCESEQRDLPRRATRLDEPTALACDAALFKVAVDTPNATPVSATASPAGALSADGKWRAQARELPRTPAAEVTGTDFEKRHASRFKGRTFDWMRFQSDGQDYPTPDPRTRPAAEIAITAVDGGQPKTITTLGMRAANVAWHPNGSDDRVHGRRHVEERTGVRAARHLHRDHERRREAPDERRLRVGVALVFAGRTVPAVGADLRHRDDHREEAVAWRLG